MITYLKIKDQINTVQYILIDNKIIYKWNTSKSFVEPYRVKGETARQILLLFLDVSRNYHFKRQLIAFKRCKTLDELWMEFM